MSVDQTAPPHVVEDGKLTVGDLRRILDGLPDDMPVVSWDTDLTGRIGPVLSVGVVETWRRRKEVGQVLFIGQDDCTSNLEEVEFVDELWPEGDTDAG